MLSARSNDLTLSSDAGHEPFIHSFASSYENSECSEMRKPFYSSNMDAFSKQALKPPIQPLNGSLMAQFDIFSSSSDIFRVPGRVISVTHHQHAPSHGLPNPCPFGPYPPGLHHLPTTSPQTPSPYQPCSPRPPPHCPPNPAKAPVQPSSRPPPYRPHP